MGGSVIWFYQTRVGVISLTRSFLARSWYRTTTRLIKIISHCHPCDNLLLFLYSEKLKKNVLHQKKEASWPDISAVLRLDEYNFTPLPPLHPLICFQIEGTYFYQPSLFPQGWRRGEGCEIICIFVLLICVDNQGFLISTTLSKFPIY